MRPLIPETPGAGAAALALLVASARAGRDTPTEATAFHLPPGAEPVSFSAAVRYLCNIAKPASVRSDLADDVVAIDAHVLASGSRERDQFEMAQRLEREVGSPLGFLRERYGDDIADLRVACRGGGLLLHVKVSDVEQWAAEYHHEGSGGYGADFADSDYPGGQGATALDVEGCAAFMSFGTGGTIRVVGDAW